MKKYMVVDHDSDDLECASFEAAEAEAKSRAEAEPGLTVEIFQLVATAKAVVTAKVVEVA